MCRASGACVLSTWQVKSTRCISTAKVLLVVCGKGMVCQRGGGEHINIYLYIHICMYTELSVQYTGPSLHVDYKFILLLLFLVLFPIIVLSMCVDR